MAGVLLGFVALGSVSVLGSLGIQAGFTLDQLCEPGRFTPSRLGIALTLGLALADSLLAGLLCRWIAGSRKAAWTLSGIVFVLSLFHALMAMTVPNDSAPPRTGAEPAEVISTQLQLQQPFVLKIIPVLLLPAGILAGSRFKRHS